MYSAANIIAAHIHAYSFLITYANICLRSASVNMEEIENCSKHLKIVHYFLKATVRCLNINIDNILH